MSTPTVRFGDFRLDPARRELWHGEQRLSLPSRVFDCIAYLIEHRDRAVGRDELIAAVWGKADVSDNVLDQTMLRARRVLGDIGDERRMILTKPRFGYSWVAPTETLEAAAADAAAADEPAGSEGDASSPRRHRRWLLPAALAAVALAAAIVVVALRGIEFSTDALARADRALVLPVAVDGGPEQAWIRLGVMDLIAGRLRATGQAVVPSDNVVALLRDVDLAAAGPAGLARIADAAAATLVLSAQAQALPGGWRVSLATVRGREPAINASGEAPDVLAAARTATDVMAQRLGLPPAPETGPPADEAVAGLLQQVEAAILADEMATARSLLDRFDAAQRMRPDVRYRSATVDFRIGRLDAAQAEFEALLKAVPAQADAVFHARVLNGLGNLYLRRDDFAAAERSADAAIAALGEHALSSELGRALTGRAIARSSQNRFQPALADFARARVVLESIGDRLALARVEVNIGILDARRDRFAEALPVLAGAGDRLAAFHDLTNELFARVTLAYTHLALCDPVAALAGDARLRELVAREPNAGRRRYANLARIDVLAANGRLAEARRLLDEVMASAHGEGDGAVLAWAQAIAARQALADGRNEEAARLAETALAAGGWDENPRERERVRLTLARVRAALGRADAGVERPDQPPSSEATPGARVYAALTEAVTASGDAASTAAFERALAEAEAGRVPDDLLQVSDAYADYLIRRGRLVRAGEVVARTADWAGRDYDAALLQLRLYHALGQPAAWRSALERARALAGERAIPAELAMAPAAR